MKAASMYTRAQTTKLTGPKTPFKASETKTHERILREKEAGRKGQNSVKVLG